MLSVLMATSKQLRLPAKKVENNRKDELYNAILDYLKQKNVGFTVDQTFESKLMLDTMLNVLWTMKFLKCFTGYQHLCQIL